MKNPLLLLGLLVTSLCSLPPAHADATALPNPFGVFNLRPFNEIPAQKQVDLAMKSGYDGLMASTELKRPLVRLREFATVPAVREGKFKIYSVLWMVRPTKKGLDENFLKEFIPIAKELNASIWCGVVGTPGEREKTIPLLTTIADQCRAGGVQLVLYPHHKCTFETAEDALDIWKKMKCPEVRLSIHLCHELKANNQTRFDEIIAKAAPLLALASINGVDTTVPFANDGWDSMILPLNEGDFDPRPYLTALASHGYRGPILLHNFGFKAKPEAYLPSSMQRWRELSAEVARASAARPTFQKP